jgi:hypothetical protein
MFEISESIEQEFAYVIADIESIPIFSMNQARNRFMSGADPWLIALARHHGGATIVTSETKNLSAYGLREVANVLGVPNISLLEYIGLAN